MVFNDAENLVVRITPHVKELRVRSSQRDAGLEADTSFTTSTQYIVGNTYGIRLLSGTCLSQRDESAKAGSQEFDKRQGSTDRTFIRQENLREDLRSGAVLEARPPLRVLGILPTALAAIGG